MRAAVEKIVKGNIETKYVVENDGDGYNNLQISNNLVSVCPFTPVTAGVLQPAIPPVTLGTLSADVVGSKINSVRGAVHFEMELIPTVSGVDPTRNVVVVLYCLESKSAHSEASVKALPGLDLLRVGRSTACDWTNVPLINVLQLKNMPLGVGWRGFKKVFHFVKNQGVVQGDNGSNQAPNTLPGGNRHAFTWRWNKDMIRYDEGGNNIGQYPINYLPMWGAVAYFTDGTNTVPASEAGMGVNISWRTEMYYKDA